jgi:hypothetical protein
MLRYNLKATALLIAVSLCAGIASVRAQQTDATKFDQAAAPLRDGFRRRSRSPR